MPGRSTSTSYTLRNTALLLFKQQALSPLLHALQVKLNIYSFENCCAGVLRKRVPRIPHSQLAAWFNAGSAGGRWRTMDYLRKKASLQLLMIDTLDYVSVDYV